VAALYASDGGRIDRSRLVAQRGVALSGAAVATAADGLRKAAVDHREERQPTCAQMQANRDGEGLENTRQGLLAG
jgi:hypothetical protein